MPAAPIHGVLDFLHRTARLQEAADATDAELLGRYVDRREGDAFEALVRRHGPMVLGVCRRLLPHPQDAEDAFQVVFLVLARKAASVRPRDRLAAWLHGVTRRAALKAREAAGRWRAREKQVKALPEPPTVAEGLWNDLKPLLDREIGRLPQKYRVAVILCDLEGKTRGEAARLLGWPEGTVAGRLARARAMLAGRLRKHGLPLSCGVLAAVASQNPASASVPLSLILSTIKAAAGLGAVTTSVAALTQKVLKTMFWTKLKTAATILLAVAVLCGGGILVSQPSALSGQPAVRKAMPPSPAVAATDPEADLPPVTAKFLRKTGGKPPMEFFDMTLEMRNPHDHPIWLVTSYWGDEPLPKDGVFKSGQAQPFGGRGYDGAAKGGRGKAVEVYMLGDAPFRAFRLPAKAAVTFEDFRVEASSDVSKLEFWEVSSLTVNGRTVLEKWLPYPTLGDEEAVIPAKTDDKNLDWDADKLASRTDYPKEEVTAVTAVVEKKWTVPITGIGKDGP